MPVERSAGVIIFRNTPGGRRYLVLRSSRKDSSRSRGRIRVAEGPGPEARYSRAEFWDFTKERLEPGETGLDAAERAAKEEAGRDDVSILPNFKETVRYFTRREGKPIPKFVAMFLGEVKTGKVTLSWEHDRYEWVTYEKARERITVPQMKAALEKAEQFLKGF